MRAETISVASDSSKISWHRLAPSVVAKRLEVTPDTGLHTADAEVRLQTRGWNRLADPPRRKAWRRFVDQFRNPLIVVLFGAAVLAGLVGDLKDTFVISVVLVLNGILGFAQEGRAEQALLSLREMLRLQVRVRRDGYTKIIPAEELVPGDIVILQPGDRVPADGRVFIAAALAVDESSLTGESTSVEKTAEAIGGDLALGDRANELFMNTTLVRGRAEMLVTNTGMTTEVGQIAGMLAVDQEQTTPLEQQLERVGIRLAFVALAAVSVVLTLSLLRGDSFTDALLGSVALAVAAIPEGLPAVVTVTLAVSVRQMAGQNAIVKRLNSVETLGATTVICSDKTGTLTLNEMTAVRVFYSGRRYEVTGLGYDPQAGSVQCKTGAVSPGLRDALSLGVLCNDAVLLEGELVGDPTEGALLTLGLKAGVPVEKFREEIPREKELPFDSTVKMMATLHENEDKDKLLLVVKGAPDVLVKSCAYVACPAEDESPGRDIGGKTLFDEVHKIPFDEAESKKVEEALADFAGEGLRVLAIASRRLVDADGDTGPERIKREMDAGNGIGLEDLTLEALVGIMDPPRAEARKAVALCRQAGVKVKMITGDHAATARAIAESLGIQGEVVTGAELNTLDDASLEKKVPDIGVCARVSPEHKVRIVQALQACGEVVAMTGDGVNDAAALRRADIGVAMGITGTEVTKEAGDMVLTDDNFATIVTAVERGRSIYENIITFVRFQLSTNLAAILTIIVARIIGFPAPFTPLQILFVNLVADGPPAMLLGLDPPRADVMQRPPRGLGSPILTVRRLRLLLFAASVMAAGTLIVFRVGDKLLSDTSNNRATALTMAFTTFVCFQLWNVLNARAEDGSVFTKHLFANGKLWVALGIVFALQVMVVEVNMLHDLFDTTGLTLSQWVICFAISSSVFVVEETRKFFLTRWRASLQKKNALTGASAGLSRHGE